MKKFLKAVALATVMCMLLSVSAFAAVDEGFGTPAFDADADTVSVQVLNAGANQQVALLVVTANADLASLNDADIQYIGQTEANASGTANFGTFAVKTADAVVDIYAGSATLATAKKIGENIDLAGVKKITIVEGADAKITAVGTGEAGVKHGFAAAITVNVPEGLEAITKMIWAFKVNNAWVYSNSIANPTNATVSGGVQFAAAFNAYNVAEDGSTSAVDVTDVAAIFLTGDDATDADNMHYTDDTLKKYGE